MAKEPKKFKPNDTLKKVLKDLKNTAIVDDDGEFFKHLQRLDQKSVQGVKPKYGIPPKKKG